jgi:hypothetical protein
VRHSRSSVADTTAETVTGDALGDAVVVAVLSDIKDNRERAVLFAHVALDLPLSAVARTLGVERKTLEETVSAVLAQLRSDVDLAARLSDVRRAGRAEHYLKLAEKLDLQDWFCAHCRRFMAQAAVGRPRKTCSDRCRKAHHRGSLPQDKSRPEGMQRPPTLQLTEAEADAMRNTLRRVIRNLDSIRDQKLISADVHARDRALILLGFTCSVQLSPVQLASLTMDDVMEKRGGLEILLRWGVREVRQYVIVPQGPEPALCPVRAMRALRACLRQSGRRDGPLFVELWRQEHFSANQPALKSLLAAGLIHDALGQAGLRPRKLLASDLLPAYLKRVASTYPQATLDEEAAPAVAWGDQAVAAPMRLASSVQVLIDVQARTGACWTAGAALNAIERPTILPHSR